MTLKQLVDAIPALNKLADSELDIKSAYKVSKVIAALKDETEFFHAKRLKIIEKHGKINEDGSVIYEPGKQIAAQNELAELLDVEVQTKIEPVELPADGIKLTANDILALSPFVMFNME